MRVSKKYRIWVVISDNTKYGIKGDRVVSISTGSNAGGGRYDIVNPRTGEEFHGISNIPRGTALEEVDDEKPRFADRLRDEAQKRGVTQEALAQQALDLLLASETKAA